MNTVSVPVEVAVPAEVYSNPLKINNYIYIGKSAHVTNKFINEVGIDLVINMAGRDITGISADAINMSLSDDELMPGEIERGRTKIANIVTKIAAFLNEGTTLFIVCEDGINKSVVVLGYFLGKSGMSPCAVLETIGKLSERAGINLLTNQSFKRILHPRGGICKCWEPLVIEYRSQENIEGII